MKHAVYKICLLCIILAGCGEQTQLGKLPGDAVILAFGDSLTYGHGAATTESYPAVLQNLSGIKVINAGVSGEVSESGLRRLPDLLNKHKPDLLIICHGGNDILRKKGMEKMANNVRQMIKLAKDKNIPVVLLGVPNFGLFLSSAPVYEEVAEETDAIFIEDLVSDILSDNDLKSDTVHPNKQGYQKMAEGIFQGLQDTGLL